jgi:hypothetical protein
LTPAIKPLLTVKGVKDAKPAALLPTTTPFSLMMAELSAANWPVSAAVEALNPVRSKAVW